MQHQPHNRTTPPGSRFWIRLLLALAFVVWGGYLLIVVTLSRNPVPYAGIWVVHGGACVLGGIGIFRSSYPIAAMMLRIAALPMGLLAVLASAHNPIESVIFLAIGLTLLFLARWLSRLAD